MISKLTDYVLMDVSPLGWETLAEETRHEFSDYDLFAPPSFVTTALFFPLAPETDKPRLVSNLATGLAYTLQRIPVFAGTLQYDSKTQRPYALQKNTDAVTFGVRYLDDETSSFPTLQQWEKAGFPDDELAHYSAQLLPPGIEPSDLPLGIRIDDGCVMSAFQVNFIPGGVILIAAFHHYQADASTCDMFANSWADSCKAISTGSMDLSSFKPCFDRTYFTRPEQETDESRVPELMKHMKAFKLFDVSPEPSILEPTLRAGPRKLPPALASTPKEMETSSRTFHFSKTNCDRLKQLCVPTEPGKFVSTYDSLVALLWRAMSRSRLPMHPEWDINTQPTLLNSAINLRDRFKVISNEYIGYAVTGSQTDPISLETLLSQSLSETAVMSRACIREITDQLIPMVLELSKAIEGKQRLALDCAFHFGPDMVATSWSKMNVYEYDFGFGLPTGFRSMPPPTDGLILLYPRCNRRGDDEGIELIVKLETQCLKRLVSDEELMQFCEIRGGQRITQ